MFGRKHYDLLAQGNNPRREFPLQETEIDCRAYWRTFKIALALCPVLGILIFDFWEVFWLGFSTLVVIILANLK